MSATAAGTELITESTLTYRVVRGTLVPYLGLYHRLRVEGRANFPAQGGALIVANHQSMLDIPIVAVATTRHVAFVARASLARSRFMDVLMRECGAVLVRPNSPDRAALEGMIAHLEQGDCVAVFPEGTRSLDGSLGEFRKGAAVAARRAGVPIVPVAIGGAFAALPRGRIVPRPARIRVAFDAPIPASEGALEQARERIAARLAAWQARA